MYRKRSIFIISLIQFIIIIFLSYGVAGTPKQPPSVPSPYDLTPKQAWEMIQKNKGNPNFVLLDVRTPKEFFARRIEGAINLDFYELNFNKELSKLDPSKTYLVYCKTGGRSASAQKIMFRMGFKKVYNMLGGTVDWKKVGLPMISGE